MKSNVILLMRIIKPLIPGGIYHIYNCGNNGESLFKEKRNYDFFLKKYQQYCSGILDTYAYVLMNNHFHFLVKVKDPGLSTGKDFTTDATLKASRQLSHFFNSYAQSFNKAYGRRGKLFEVPFKRKRVEKESYFLRLVRYIHCNPEYHGFVSDFRQWEYSSWHAFSNESPSGFLAKEEVLSSFGSRNIFECYHTGQLPETDKVDQNIDPVF